MQGGRQRGLRAAQVALGIEGGDVGVDRLGHDDLLGERVVHSPRRSNLIRLGPSSAVLLDAFTVKPALT